MTKALRAKLCPGCQARTASLSGSASVISGKRVAASACPAARSTRSAVPISAADKASSGCAAAAVGVENAASSSDAARKAVRAGLRLESSARSDAVILPRDIAVGVVRQECGGDKADHRAGENVERNGVTRMERGEQRRRDQRRRTAGADRGELGAERGA